MKRPLLAVLSTAVALAVAVPASTAGATSSRATPPTLAGILLADARFDGPEGFDRYPYDTDIVTQAVLLFPDLVAAASDPGSDLTVFLPTDLAFRRLVYALTGTWVASEADVFAAVAGLGVDTVKAVLTYHIVPGSIDGAAALAADGAELSTLNPAGATITVDVLGPPWRRWITLVDNDPDLRNPSVVVPDLHASNGIAHIIDRVLLPIDV